MEVKDILLKDNDLWILNGDFVVGESDQQHIENILINAPGQFKQNPLIGVDLITSMNAANDGQSRNALRKKIQLHLESDNYTISKIDLSNIEDIGIEANRSK